MYLEGALFEAGDLVNGNSVIRERGLATVTYHHVEVEGHALLLAEGALSETFLDHGHKHLFNGETLALYPLPPHPRRAATCAPLIREGAALEALRARLAGHAATQQLQAA